MGRIDGKRASYIDPMMQLMPHIMPRRYDACNTTKVTCFSKPIEEFIADQKAKGEIFSFNDVFLASLVRLYSKREALNRFVIARKIYDRYTFSISFVIKKGLRDAGEETVVKVEFDGSETLYEVRDKIKQVVESNLRSTDVNSLDIFMDKLVRMPSGLLAVVVGFLKWLDKVGLWGKGLMNMLPFHTSCFVTFMKSIKGNYIYHHIYDFGTASMFLALGKEQMIPVVKEGEIKSEKTFTIGAVMDERFCDGLYYVNSVRMWEKMLNDPSVLLEPGEKKFTKKLVLERRKKLMKEKKQKMADKKRLIKQNKKELKAQRKQKKLSQN